MGKIRVITKNSRKEKTISGPLKRVNVIPVFLSGNSCFNLHTSQVYSNRLFPLEIVFLPLK